MRLSVLMTVFKRSAEVLATTVRHVELAAQAAPHPSDSIELVVVNDGCDPEESEWLEELIANRSMRCVLTKSTAAKGEYNIDGHNNPARAFNDAFAASSGYRVVALSSDVIIPRNYLTTALMPGTVVYPCMDLDEGRRNMVRGRNLEGEPQPPHTLWNPMPWCLATDRKHIEAIGGWDTKFMQGMACEDNDFVASLLREVGEIICPERGPWCIHQSHISRSYDDDGHGQRVNADYLRAKWGCIPFWQPGPFKFSVSECDEGLRFVAE